jgi:hypothetical protein
MSVFLSVWGSSGDTAGSAKVSLASRLAAGFRQIVLHLMRNYLVTKAEP